MGELRLSLRIFAGLSLGLDQWNRAEATIERRNLEAFQPSGDELTAEINAFAQERLAKYKRPKTIDYIEEMPRDPNGKLYKRKLRDPYWEGRERAI